MARGINKVEVDLYLSGMSIPEVAAATGTATSTVRFRLKRAGVLRSRADGVRKAGTRGRLGSGFRGKRRIFSADHKAAISKAQKEWAEKHAKGVSLKPSGYLEYTRGPNKGRNVHVVAMEDRIGRRLHPDEVVHHIDGDKQNNTPDNLALCTRSGHTRLHRFEDQLSGFTRERKANGTWD